MGGSEEPSNKMTRNDWENYQADILLAQEKGYAKMKETGPLSKKIRELYETLVSTHCGEHQCANSESKIKEIKDLIEQVRAIYEYSAKMLVYELNYLTNNVHKCKCIGEF